MPRNDEDTSVFQFKREARHWLEYGVFAFVVFTAMATATAAWYTRREWESSVDNGHRQLRAYIFPDRANLVWQTAKPMVAEIIIRNSGQTPAYELSTATSVMLGDNPIQGEPRAPAMTPNHTVVPPAGSYALAISLPWPLTAEQLTAVQKGTQAIYVLGEISYEDAFGECRMTRYRFFYSGPGTDNGGKVGFSYLDEGNTEFPCSNARH